jgi:hypothetical protein
MILLDDKIYRGPNVIYSTSSAEPSAEHPPACIFKNLSHDRQAEASLQLGLVQRGLRPTFKILTVAVLPDPASASPNTTRKPAGW